MSTRSGNGSSVAHYNGTWSIFGTVGNKRWNGVWGDSSSDIFIVGNSGTIAHYDGSVWTMQNSGLTHDLLSVWGASGTDVFVAGGAGTILHYDGTTWRRVTSNTEPRISGSLVNAGTSHDDDVFVARAASLRTALPGISWAPMGLPFGNIRAVHQPE